MMHKIMQLKNIIRSLSWYTRILIAKRTGWLRPNYHWVERMLLQHNLQKLELVHREITRKDKQSILDPIKMAWRGVGGKDNRWYLQLYFTPVISKGLNVAGFSSCGCRTAASVCYVLLNPTPSPTWSVAPNISFLLPLFCSASASCVAAVAYSFFCPLGCMIIYKGICKHILVIKHGTLDAWSWVFRDKNNVQNCFI